jgi:acetyl-CoA carboxylase biotin carboxyl carrier protein
VTGEPESIVVTGEGDDQQPERTPEDAGPVAPGASDAALAGPDTALTEPDTAVVAADASDPARAVADGGDRSLLELVDRLAQVLERSDLTELEVEAGATAIVLRKPAALVAAVPAAVPEVPVSAAPARMNAPESGAEGAVAAAPSRPSVKAPLTGIYYASPSPGSPPYVRVGGEIAVGQIIGLIEAMKLFNEIKSDLAGRVVRVVAESGQLVKAKQPLIEVEAL